MLIYQPTEALKSDNHQKQSHMMNQSQSAFKY